MKILSSDVGACTQDIHLFDSHSGSKNGSSQQALGRVGTGDAFR
jgi:uncharacterized protein (DUF1786 family)